MPLLLWIYQKLTPFLKGGVWIYTWFRLKKGKEDPCRLTERFGKASKSRPVGSIAWFHGASVGEAVSLLPILQRIRTQFPHVTPLMTTGTVTAAHVISDRLPEGCIHQYSPLDVPKWVDSFLDHWQPEIAVFVESEFWPNLILSCHARKIPLYLINACLSEKSYQSWQRFSTGIGYLLSCFESCFAQSEAIAQRLLNLGVAPSKVRVCGNLKFAASPLPYDAGKLKALQSMVAERPIWVAASTHFGEETMVGEAHHMIKKAMPNVLTILIPRHPGRGAKIAEGLANQGLQVAKRSKGEKIQSSTDVYLVDTMGEVGLFYRLSEVVFLGGTLVPTGGHNPIEPLLLDCALIWGPYTHKQTAICDILKPAACVVATQEALATTVAFLLKDQNSRQEKIKIARQLLATQAHVLEDVVETLGKKLAVKNGGSDGTRTRGLRRDRPAL